MMKKLLIAGSIATLLLPTLAFASTGDVNLTTSTTISVNSIPVDISGSTAAIESLTVNATDFSFVLNTGSSIQLTASGMNVLNADNAIWQTAATVCDGSSSVLGYNNQSGSSVTITVSPSATLCADPTPETTRASHGDGRSGGGNYTAAVVAAPVLAVTPVVANPAMVSALKAQLVVLIQQLLILLNQQVTAMQANGGY